MGQPSVFNSNPEGPTFYYEVRDDYGHILPPLNQVAMPDPVMIPAQSSIILTNNMSALYPMSKPGSYSIQPCVDWRGKTYRGEKRHIEVVVGREVIRTSGSMPDQSSRTYLIYHINRSQQDHILIRIDDDQANLCYGVFSLGRAIINTAPELAVDANGNAHVLFQSAPGVYIHATYSPQGTLIDQQTFGQSYSRVRLETGINGGIEAVGSQAQRTGPRKIDSIIQNR